MEMRHAWVFLGALGCGISGEPINGDITMSYGSSAPEMAVGTAVQTTDQPDKMLVQIGTDHVECDTYLDVFLDFNAPEGHFVYFHVDKVPGVHAQAAIDVMKVKGNSTSINGTFGMVTIDAAEPRVTGSLTVTTEDQDVGTISVSGTFDVVRCF
jgi:hypothetical protein